MSNINSFAQNINLTIKSQANQLALLLAMQKAVTDNNTVVNYEYTDTDGNTMKYQLPSYESIINRLQAVEKSLNSLTTGQGTINLTDGTRRTVQISSVPKTPNQITGLTDPTTFTVDSNWFFEELMFPGARVSIDLTNQIEDSADRVKVSRIILAANNDAARQIWENDLSVNSYDYVSLKTILSNNGIPYYEDEQIVELPLVSNTVAGTFQITQDPVSKNGNIWYYLDSITYSTISANGTDQGQNNILSIGDMLLYDDSIFKITNINQNDRSVVLSRVSGVQTPGAYSVFSIYTDPFASKVVNVRFGAHEYDIIYFKGITEAYNLLANTWSTPVKFATDSLILEGTSGLQEQSFASYYAQYIMDWGSSMIAEVKERKISAWSGNIPNTPSINGDEFRVVQINTQINAAIDTMDAKNTASEIESVKSQISSLKSTIAAQKADLQSAVNLYTYNSIQQQIATNTTDLNNLQTTYSTLVDSFQTLVKENSAITTEPKYHIRGFFPIPEYKYHDEENNIKEEIIGFDIAYRYIKEDNTATQLNTFTYTNADGTEVTGTFTDWIVETGPMKTKVYDEDLARYVWKTENVADGTETNINQIDIAINKGEQVEIKVRAISECGYPENPLRSEWSNSVIKSFPSTLATSNEIADLITMVNDDALNISITNMLDSVGVTTHLNDTIPNTNSVNGMYYKHTADNIAYEETGTSSDGTTVTNSISLQDKISQLFTQISDNAIQAKTNRNDIDNLTVTESEHYTENSANIAVLQTDTVDISTHVSNVEEKIDSIRNSEGYVYTEKLILKNENGEEDVALSSLNQSELFLINNHDGTFKDLTDLHVRRIYVHPEGATTSQRYDVANMITDVSNFAYENSKKIETIDTQIAEINEKITDIAYISDVDKVQDSLNTLSDKVLKVVDDGDITANRVFLGTRGTRLEGTAGKLSVFEGEGATLGTIELSDAIVDGNNITDVIGEVNDNTTNISQLRTEHDSLSNNVDSFSSKNSQNKWTLSAQTGVFSEMTSTTITGDSFVITSAGGAFKPTMSDSQSGMLASATFSEVQVYTNGAEIGKPITMSDLNERVGKNEDNIESLTHTIDGVIVTNDDQTSFVTADEVQAKETVQANKYVFGNADVAIIGNTDGIEFTSTVNPNSYVEIKVADLYVKESADSFSRYSEYTKIVQSNKNICEDVTNFIKPAFNKITTDGELVISSVNIYDGAAKSLVLVKEPTYKNGYVEAGIKIAPNDNNTKIIISDLGGNSNAKIDLEMSGNVTCNTVFVHPNGSSDVTVDIVKMLLSATSSNATLANTVSNYNLIFIELYNNINEIVGRLKAKDNTLTFDIHTDYKP